MYDPRIGRWVSEDPIGFAAADPNLYRYVRNNPVNATDPSGLLKAETRFGPTGGDYGAFVWAINWKLARPAGRNGGVILQRVKVTYYLPSIKDPKVNYRPSALRTVKFNLKDNWWEAWVVPPRRTEPNVGDPTYGQNGMSDEARKLYKAWDIDVGADVKANDWWFMPGFTADLPKDPRSLCHDLDLAKHPWIKVEGWAYYYDGMTYKDLGKAGFRAGQQGPIFPFITPAGGLPYYGLDSPTAKGGDDLQELWRKFPHPREGPLYRVLKAEIQPNGKTTVTAGGINIPDVATAR